MNTKSNCIRTEKTDTVLRPYEKCLTLGAETLSDAELLAVILRTGVSGMNSIELSADGPLRPPYTAFFQGGLTWYHAKYGIMMSMQKLYEAGILSF